MYKTTPVDCVFPIEGEDPGINKREYFAGLAMQGLLAADLDWEVSDVPDEVAKVAVKYADALIKALNESQK